MSTPTYAPCPQCRVSNASPVRFTWWGGALGPKLITHVKCQQCGTAYNGKSGKSNATGIAIYCAVGFAIVFVIAIIAVMAGLMK